MPAGSPANAEQPMDEDEFRIAVSRAVRKGSVAAMRLHWDLLRADRDEPAKPEDGFRPPARSRLSGAYGITIEKETESASSAGSTAA
jgi:hypothetical protein